MNRGRFIGLAGVPVLFFSSANLANEVNPAKSAGSPAPTSTPVAAPADAAWAQRWRAAVAELAARKVARQRQAVATKTTPAKLPAPTAKTLAKAAPSPTAQVNAAAAAPKPVTAVAPAGTAARSPATSAAPAKAAPAPKPAAVPAPAAPARTRITPIKTVEPARIAAAAPAAAKSPALQKTQLLAMAPRRPKIPGAEAPAPEAPPADATPPAAPGDAGAIPPVAGTDAAAPADSAVATQPSTGYPTAPSNPDDELVPLEEYKPFGYADSPVQKSRNLETGFGGRNRRVPQSDFLPVPDRYRIGLPGDYVQNTRGSFFDPYNQNVLKGDYPIIDRPGHEDDLFLILTATSDTLFEARRLPVPTSVSPHLPGEFKFFDHTGNQQLVNQNFILTAEFFEGDTVYKPRDFEFRATVVGNLNFIHTEQTQVVNIDFREGVDRYDEEFAFQELFFEKHLMDLSASYDVLALRVGIQGFNSDFRGFLFSDNLPGIRLFGNYDNNRWQYNLAYFRQVEKDTNSGLNTFNDRNQNIIVANVYRQDFIWPGYTTEFSVHYNNDHSSDERQYDRNGFLVRPAPVGTIGSNDVDVVYLGWGGDGHIGRLNITHQFYEVLGRESFNAIAGREVEVNAQFAALELSYDVDYVRYRASVAYASGDGNPTDGNATGFDSIFDNTNFAGGGISYFIRQPVRLTGSGVGLKQRLSLFPDLRTSKEQGQANFVNPGLLLFNLGADIEVTPKLKLITNASYLRFVNSNSMELILQDNQIDEEIGWDISVGAIYRPFLNNNVIVNAGAACLIPGQGFKGLYDDELLYSFFTGITFTY